MQTAQQRITNVIGPVVPGDITFGSFTDGSATIEYERTGNLIFNIRCIVGTGPGSHLPIGGDISGFENVSNAARIAAKLSTTVNALYTIDCSNSVGYQMFVWNSVQWTTGGIFGNQVLGGILLN